MYIASLMYIMLHWLMYIASLMYIMLHWLMYIASLMYIMQPASLSCTPTQQSGATLADVHRLLDVHHATSESLYNTEHGCGAT
jgi:hypothetical protein